MFLVRRARWRPSSADPSQPSAFCFQREAARHPDRQPRSVNDWRDFTAPMAQQKSYHLSLTRMRESVGRDRMLRLVLCIQLPSVAIGVGRSVHAKSAAKSSVKTMKANRKQAARPKLWRCFWDCDGNIWHVFCSFTDNKVRFLHRSAVTHPDVTVSLQQGRSKLSDQGVTRSSLRCVGGPAATAADENVSGNKQYVLSIKTTTSR